MSASRSVIRAFWRVERARPAVRPAIWRLFYGAVATAFPHEDLKYMNWGWWPVGDAQPPDVGDVPDEERSFVHLYAATLAGVDVAGRDVVEVGSGRGGGAAWIARQLRASSVVGVELAPAAVRLARRLHAGVPGLTFVCGEAEALPLAGASADVVVNVESCHHYASMPAFLREVHRVLRPGGWLALSDYRDVEELDALDADIDASPFAVVARADVTANVVAALERDHAFKERLVRERAPRPFHTILRTFLGTRGTDVHDGLSQGSWAYRRYLLRKELP